MGINMLHNQHNAVVSDSLGKVDLLNDYFFSIFTKEDTSTSLDPTLLIPPIGKVIVTPNGVQKLLNALNANKAGGPDKLPTRILKELPQEMAPLLAYLFQQSLGDRVPHERLLSKLNHYGIQGDLLAWIKNFLTQRTQSVTLEGVTSRSCPVTSGVPQGTVSGPLLFLLFVNDLPQGISSSIRLFADDCLLYRTINDIGDSLSLQNDLIALSKWEKDWQMAFNIEKCHTMCISTGKMVNPGYHYTLNNYPLERVHHHSYLGVLLSEDLKWASHIAQTTSGAYQTLRVIRRNFRAASAECKSKLYCSLVRPKLEYANSVWYSYLQKDKHRLDMVQTKRS